MKKILHVVNIYFVIPYFLGDQLIYFTKKGYKEYIVCSPSEEIYEYSKSHNFDYKEIPIMRSFSLIPDLKACWKICKYIKEERMDIVVGHTPKGGLLAMLSSFIMRVPVRIYFRHGLVYETSSGIKKKILIFMDRLSAYLSTKVVCVSSSVCKKSLENKLNSASKQILFHKGTCNGIDVEKFCRENINKSVVELLRSQLGIPENAFVIGFVGRLVKDKGIIELIDAFNILQKQNENIKLLLVGMLEERDSLPENVITSIQYNTSIICTGYVDNSLIENYYALMNLFVLLSYREGFPTSILEASSMRLPVVTTKVTGCIDAIVNGKTGFFVNHDKFEIASVVQKYIFDNELREKHGIAGRAFVEENYEQLIVWREIEKLYNTNELKCFNDWSISN